MKWIADQYFGMIENEFPGQDTPLGTYRLNLLEKKDWEEKNKYLTILQREKEKVEENLSATYWG